MKLCENHGVHICGHCLNYVPKPLLSLDPGSKLFYTLAVDWATVSEINGVSSTQESATCAHTV